MYGKNTEALLYNKDSAKGTNLSAQLSAVEMGGKTRARRPFFPGNFLSQSRADVTPPAALPRSREVLPAALHLQIFRCECITQSVIAYNINTLQFKSTRQSLTTNVHTGIHPALLQCYIYV